MKWTWLTVCMWEYNTGSPGAGAMHESVDSDSASKKSSSTRGRLKSHLPHNISSELLGIAEQLHPMLAVIFIDCPYTFTIDIFGRFLVSCINSLRCQVNHHQLYLGEVEASSWDQKKVMSKSGSVELGLDEDDGGEADTSSEEKEQDEALVNVSKFTSCVTRVVCKLLLLAESYQPVDIVHRRNYEVLMDTLRSFAMLGREEAAVLLKLGGAHCFGCAWLFHVYMTYLSLTLQPIYCVVHDRCLSSCVLHRRSPSSALAYAISRLLEECSWFVSDMILQWRIRAGFNLIVLCRLFRCCVLFDAVGSFPTRWLAIYRTPVTNLSPYCSRRASVHLQNVFGHFVEYFSSWQYSVTFQLFLEFYQCIEERVRPTPPKQRHQGKSAYQNVTITFDCRKVHSATIPDD